MKDLILRLRALFLRRRVERDLNDELDFHIEMQVRKNIARGMSETEARRQARLEFGGETRIKEQCRDQQRISFVETLYQDVRYALRGFRKTPIFALSVVATIALGLGLNTAVFTIFNAYALRPISVRDPYSLYQLIGHARTGGFEFTLPDYEQLRAHQSAFSQTFAIHSFQMRVSNRNIFCELISGNAFPVLGVNAFLGRTILPSDDLEREPVVMLGYGAWNNMFAGDPEIIGKKVLLHGHPFEIVGVAPEGFGGMAEIPQDFWVPLSWMPQIDPSDGGVGIIGRLKSGLSEQQAQAMLTVTGQQITADRLVDRRMNSAILRSHATQLPLSGDAILLLTPLISVFGLVLLIACANVANMMLARAMARQREIGIRLSLGATRSRLIRQLLTESVLLAIPSAALGFVISEGIVQAGVRLLTATLPAEFLEYLRIIPIPLDLRVFAFMMTAAIIAAVLFGLAPALQATRCNIAKHHPSRLRSALVVVQISGCALLLICTGVLLRAATRVHSIDNGMNTSQVIEIQVEGKSRARILSSLRSEPLIQTVAASSTLPFDSAFPIIPGIAQYDSVSPEFFEVFKIPILQGRDFTRAEALDRSRVAIITLTLANHLFPHGDAVGQSIHFDKTPAVRVIGIVRDINTSRTNRDSDRSTVFFPIPDITDGTSLIMRVNGDTDAARQRIDSLLEEAVPGGIDEIHKMDFLVTGRQYIFRVAYWVSGAVGALALILAFTGIYGVLSYLVVQRRKEIGIRLALGASGKQVMTLVLKQSFRLAVAGLAVGTAIGLGISQLLASQVQAIDTFDLTGYSAAIAVVFAACLFAGFFPSLRAARINPVTTLRYD